MRRCLYGCKKYIAELLQNMHIFLIAILFNTLKDMTNAKFLLNCKMSLVSATGHYNAKKDDRENEFLRQFYTRPLLKLILQSL